CRADAMRLYVVFLVAMTLINFGRNCVMTIQSQYLFLDSGFGVSSKMLGYIFNTETAAIILLGLFSGGIGRRIGNGRAVCLGALASAIYLVLFVTSDHLVWIFIANFIRGAGAVIILAASYAMASILIPPDLRGRLFGYFNATLFLSWGVAGTLIAGPIVDTMEFMGFAQAAAYKAAYLAALAMTLAGLGLQLVLVFILMPRAGIRKAVT
ncbi:MAG: MFS transporter, partial [Desulfosalsimonas sp.]